MAEEVIALTRKQAISQAIQVLLEAGQHEEAIEILQNISDELPLNRWSDRAIRDSIDQFILDHGRIPNVSDFKMHGLPPHPVIKNRYGVTLQTWLAENYPVEPPDREALRIAVSETFITEYLRIRPCSSEKYDAMRTPGTPCWYTVARHNGTTRWRALLETLDLPVYSNVEVPCAKPDFKVHIISDYDFRDDLG